MMHSGSQKTSMRRGLTLLELLIVLTIIVILMSLILPAKRGSRESARIAQCTGQLKQIASGLESYRDSFGVFPPAFTVDKNGKPLHSWRTLVLPYIGQEKLYESIDLSKPWDDPVNAKAFQEIPRDYWCPNSGDRENKTLYLGVAGKHGYFEGSRPRRSGEITDKPEETLMVIEVGSEQGVPWMAPLDADEKMILNFTATTKWPHGVGRQAAFVDGSARTLIASETTVADLKRMMTIAGGD